jgi:hypothetical protein
MEQIPLPQEFEKPLLVHYLTTIEQSKFLFENKVRLHNVFFHVREGDEWFIDSEPSKTCEEVYPAYMLEELKTFLPLNFVTTKLSFPVAGKPNTFLVKHVCSPDPRIHEGVDQVTHPLRELDAVYFMIATLISSNRMDPDKPMLLKKQLIHSIDKKLKGKIINING